MAETVGIPTTEILSAFNRVGQEAVGSTGSAGGTSTEYESYAPAPGLFEFKEDITQINFDKEIIALWFFRERSDNNHPPVFVLKDKLIAYMPNQFLITEYKDIKIQEAKRKFIRRPLIQLDIKKSQYKDLIAKIK